MSKHPIFITAHTPQGTFKSLEKEISTEDLTQLRSMLERANELTYFRMDTEHGELYIPKPLIGQSVFVLNVV